MTRKIVLSKESREKFGLSPVARGVLAAQLAFFEAVKRAKAARLAAWEAYKRSHGIPRY